MMSPVDSGKAAYAVYDPQTECWLYDTCAGGTWRHDVTLANEYESETEAREALAGAEIAADGLLFLRVR